MNVKLRYNNLDHVPFNKTGSNFTFIVNGETYQTSRFLADVLSPAISRLHEIDESISFFEINTNEEGDFNKILEYAQMNEIFISESELDFFRIVLYFLENYEEFTYFSPHLEEEITFENLFSRINLKNKIGIDTSNEVSFIASNFDHINSEYHKDLLLLDDNLYEQILSHPNLKIRDEDVLFDFILELYQKSSKFSFLFQYICFINVSQTSISSFITIFKLENISQQIWNQICTRLSQELSKDSHSFYYEENKGKFFNRYLSIKSKTILQDLVDSSGGLPYSYKEFYITSSSVIDDNCKPENVLVDNESYFYTKREYDSWLMFDFKDKQVLLESYSLKTFNYGPNYSHLKSWILEGSDDGENFEEIDRQDDNDRLNGNLKSARFYVSHMKPQRYIRLKRIGPSWGNGYYLILNKIEFSGNIFTK